MKIPFLIPLTLLACSQSNKENHAEANNQPPAEIPRVEVLTLTPTPFLNEQAYNGTLHAQNKSVLKFEASEQLAYLPFKNGDRVSRGQTIARLRSQKLKQAAKQAQLNLAKAKLDYKDLLLGQGYSLADSASIPTEVAEVAAIRSGYANALNELEKAQYNLKATELIAPFSGVVANLKYKLHETVSAGEEFCILIDNSQFEVEFSILETELPKVQIGNAVRIEPFANSTGNYPLSSEERAGGEVNNTSRPSEPEDQSHLTDGKAVGASPALSSRRRGEVSEINPLIDENGLIKVKALMKSSAGLIDGMNVKVFIEKSIANQLVVPRTAVVLRQNQHVLFRYTKGMAYWTYIDILHENSTSYAVRARADKNTRLLPGDTVIVAGNMNLAHETEVEIK